MKRSPIRLILPLLICLFTICAFIPESIAKEQTDSGYSIKKSYNKVSKDLVRLRGLSFKKTVPYDIKSTDFLRQFLIKSLKEDMPEDKFKIYDLSLKKFGFVPQNFDTWNFLINVYTAEVAGLYDYKTKTLMLMEGKTKLAGAEQQQLLEMVGLSTGDILLIHEMTHALQDQYFNLKQMIEKLKKEKNDDYENAVQALIEGDATYVMMLYMFDTLGGTTGGDMSQFMDLGSMRHMMGDMSMHGSSAQFAKAPLFFKRIMLFPYLDGMIFVEGLKKKGGWDLVNKAYNNPPKSTEQVLHFERYITKDQPILLSWIEMPDAIGGWKMVDENSAGELIIRILFEQFLPQSDYRSIAGGWGGDRYRLYQKGKDTFLVWFTTWDREQDAREFFKYYLELLKVKYPDLAWTKTHSGKAYLGRVGSNHVYAAISGKDVLTIETCPPELTQAMLKLGWYVNKKSWK